MSVPALEISTAYVESSLYPSVDRYLSEIAIQQARIAWEGREAEKQSKGLFFTLQHMETEMYLDHLTSSFGYGSVLRALRRRDMPQDVLEGLNNFIGSGPVAQVNTLIDRWSAQYARKPFDHIGLHSFYESAMNTFQTNEERLGFVSLIYEATTVLEDKLTLVIPRKHQDVLDEIPHYMSSIRTLFEQAVPLKPQLPEHNNTQHSATYASLLGLLLAPSKLYGSTKKLFGRFFGDE